MPRKPSYRNFLSVLTRQPAEAPTLFEPYLSPVLAEQLIWRRGPQLWDTPEHYADTMVSLRERMQADVAILDAGRFPVCSLAEMLDAAACRLTGEIRLAVICHDPLSLHIAEENPYVCAIAGYGNTAPGRLPFIRMDGTPEDAFREGAAGYFARDNAEELLRTWRGRLTVCGGLGAELIAADSPVGIHHRVEALWNESGGTGVLIGSGGTIGEDAYLSLISMLGITIRLRK